MSRYRWLRPSKCLETMPYYLSMKGLTYEEMERRLYEAVKRGDVRLMFNDEVVPRVHIGVYLNLYARASPDQDLHTLPPDVQLSYDDLEAVFDRPAIDNRRRGRPVKQHPPWSEDRRLAHEMHKMLARVPPQATSATDAARQLVQAGRVAGGGTPESLEKRLVRKFRKYYSS